MTSPTLKFISINPIASRTILFLHGALSSHREWDLVRQTGLLSKYHLLIADLPSHGRSSSASIPFNLPDTSALLADLITKHAKHEKAHVVGMSLGAYTAAYTVAQYPHVIDGLFLSGCQQIFPAPGSWKALGNVVGMYLASCLIYWLPEFLLIRLSAKLGLQINDDLRGDIRASAAKGGRGIMAALSLAPGPNGENGWKGVFEKVEARTLVVAGVLEDNEEDCRERGRQLRVGNMRSRAFKVQKGHAWNLQDPEIFARGIVAWIEECDEMEDGFVELE